MSDTDKPFTVSDRRHFTSEGRPRDEAAEPGAPSAGEREPPSGEERAEGAPAGPVEFGQFVLSLGAQAGALIAGRGLPEGMDEAQALEGARSIIAILEMLKDKTEGRRTSEESTLLDGLLFELHMGYVEKTRAGSK
jgi:hypothetical protein